MIAQPLCGSPAQGGQVATALERSGQQSAYIQYSPEVFPGDGEVADESTKNFLSNYMAEFRIHLVRVLTVLPR